MRAFVAIELNDVCRRRLAAAVERLRPLADGVRWVDASSAHLTLKFIGGLARTDLPAVVECLSAAAGAAGPFEMNVAGVSGFPPRGIPRVITVGVDEPTGALAALQASVERALFDALGLAGEKRAYVPHITLGRAKDRRNCPRVETLVAALPEHDFGRVCVASFVLMESELRPAGAVYRVVDRFGVLDPGSRR